MKKTDENLPIIFSKKKQDLAKQEKVATLKIESPLKDYYEGHIEDLEKRIDKLNPKYVEHLEFVITKLSGHCLFRARKINMLQCRRSCQWKTCKTFEDWLILLNWKIE